MLLLLLSILALFIGIGIYPVIRKFPASLSFFDAFVLISIIGLTMLHLIPHSVENGGIWGLLAVAVGLTVPAILHKLQHHTSESEHHDTEHAEHPHHHNERKSGLILIIIVFFGFIIHTILDGIGLSMTAVDDMGNMLALGVLFHRLPVGIFLSMILVPRLGLKKTWAIIIALAATTSLGFVLGHYTLPSAGLIILNVVQGLIAGTLLHVVFHNISVEGRADSKISKGIGALAGFGALAVIEWIAPVHGHEHASMLDSWCECLINAAPVWCIAALVMAIVYGAARLRSPGISAFFSKLSGSLDPQPMPNAFGGSLHIFSAAGIALLLTIFTYAPASAWWFTTALAIVPASLCLKRIACCSTCHPESLCDREKNFSLWMASSWTLIAMMSLIATVFPGFVAPLTEFFEHIPAAASIGIMISLDLAIILYALQKRSMPLVGIPLLMFGLISIFHAIPGAILATSATGTLLLFLYDFHPRDMASAIEHDHPWIRRYVLIAITCLIIAAAPGILAISNDWQPESIVRISIESHEHHHHHEDADEHHHEDADEHHHEDADEHHHEHDAVPAHENERGISEHSAASMHETHPFLNTLRTNPLLLISFVIFILAGLFWILRLGPRHLFETALGKRQHKHG